VTSEEPKKDDRPEPQPITSRSIALVSGKGGTGKTMVAAVFAQILSSFGPTLIVDADTGTAGMTYYLGLKLVPNIRVGLADIVAWNPAGPAIDEDPKMTPHASGKPEAIDDRTLLGLIQDVRFRPSRPPRPARPFDSWYNCAFFGIGDHRRLYRAMPDANIDQILPRVVKGLEKLQSFKWIVIDCRGGVDKDSVAVCSAVNDIILIVEPDTTSFQATQHVVDILSSNRLAHKLRGFIINKVFDDPSVIARNGTSVFGSQYLGSVPFDLDATRSFLVGDVPKLLSPFGINIWAALSKIYPKQVRSAPGSPWEFKDFRRVGLTDPNSLLGGLVIAGLIFLAALGLASYFLIQSFTMPAQVYADQPHWLPPDENRAITDWALAQIRPILQKEQIFLLSLIVLGLIGSLEPARRLVGKALSAYVRILKRPFQ
jgi:septum site-determining protein MinD